LQDQPVFSRTGRSSVVSYDVAVTRRFMMLLLSVFSAHQLTVLARRRGCCTCPQLYEPWRSM